MPKPAGYKHHRCRTCRLPVVNPGYCGFCIEQESGVLLTGVDQVVNDPQTHRLRTAMLQAGEVDRAGRGGHRSGHQLGGKGELPQWATA